MIAIISLSLAAVGILFLYRALCLMQAIHPRACPPAVRIYIILGFSLVALGFVGIVTACARLLLE